MRRPQMSGHCSSPQTKDPELSHRRCKGGNTYNPDKEFQPCPCHCHLGTDEFNCGNCGRPLREAPLWPNEDEPDEMVYVHVEPDSIRAIGEDCY